MSIEVHNEEAAAARIVLAGRFEFATHRDFRRACLEVLDAAAGRAIVVDLGAVDYLDSAALGMLLVLKERAEQADRTLSLDGCHGALREILRIAGIDAVIPVRG